MITRKQLMLTALGACLIGFAGLGSEKNPVERPHKVWSQFHIVINVGTPFGSGDFTFESWGTGQGTHTGQFTSYLYGQMDPATMKPISGTGTITAANGDQLFVSVPPDGITTVITGGTGRFEGATGSQVATVVGVPTRRYDPATGTVIVDLTQEIEGTITY